MLKYLFTFVALISITLGFREFWITTKDLISYNQKESFLFINVYMEDIQILDTEYVTFSTANQAVVYRVLLKNKEIAIFDLPKDSKNFQIKRDTTLDSTVSQIFTKVIATYKVVKSIKFYFIEHYLVSFFLVIFGMLFFIAVYALIKGPLEDLSCK